MYAKYYCKVSASPQQILSTSDSKFKSSFGLSSKKIEYIKDLSARVTGGRVNLSILPELTYEEIVTQLRHAKGIGRWTAEMLLIFCLGRPSYPLGIWA
jgi:DNA-3-methyladenine glycosylase II